MVKRKGLRQLAAASLTVAALFVTNIATASTSRDWLAAHVPDDAEVRLGIGLFASRFPDYPGSAESDSLLLPFPFFSYYSENLEVDGSEAVGRLFAGEKWELNLNFSGSIPTRSKDNARDGMDKLGWIGEMGPSLDFALIESPHHQLHLRLPVRAAVAAKNFDFDYLGLRFDPQIRNQIWFADQFVWDTTVAFTWSERRYHQFMYGVREDDVTASRSFYQAPGGFSGFRVSTGLSRQLNQHWWLGGFVRYQDLNNVAFAQSPLMERTSGWSFGFAIARIIYQQ